MANTYYSMLEGGGKEYVLMHLKGLDLWENLRFWEVSLFDEIVSEREKFPPHKPWRLMSQEERDDTCKLHLYLLRTKYHN
jgi:hypothetical protein